MVKLSIIHDEVYYRLSAFVQVLFSRQINLLGECSFRASMRFKMDVLDEMLKSFIDMQEKRVYISLNI